MADQVMLEAEDGVEIPPRGPVPVDHPRYAATYKPSTELGALIRAEFAKHGWKVGDVAKMLGRFQSNVSGVINQSRGRFKNGRRARDYSLEAEISKLIGFSPFPPREIPRQNSTPLGMELQAITRRPLLWIDNRFGLPEGSVHLVCIGHRSERAEPVIERLLGRKLFHAPFVRNQTKNNKILREIQAKGWTLQAIGDEVGATREWVRQVCLGGWQGTPARSPKIEAKVTEILGYDPFPALNRPPRKAKDLRGLTPEQKRQRQNERARNWYYARRVLKSKHQPDDQLWDYLQTGDAI